MENKDFFLTNLLQENQILTNLLVFVLIILIILIFFQKENSGKNFIIPLTFIEKVTGIFVIFYYFILIAKLKF